MPDIVISPLVETWKIANLTIWPLALTDVPGLGASNPLPPLAGGNPVWIDALDYTTAEILAASDTFRNSINNGQATSQGYQHTHLGLYDPTPIAGAVPDATGWHSHSGLDILTGGATSNADALHTHDNFTTISDVDAAISTAIGDLDLSVYVTKAGSITQLADITSTGAEIESAVSQAHAEGHTLLEHLDDDPVTMANLIKLFDGSNADCLHVHSGGTGTFDGEHNDLDGLNDGDYVHLTAAEFVEFGTLTDGSNADALHTHNISALSDVNITSVSNGDILTWNTVNGRWENVAASISGVHNDLEGLQGGSFLDPSNEEYYHLSYDEYIGLTGGDVADDYHIHTSYNILLGINCDPSTSRWNDGLFAWDEETRVACALDDVNELLSSLAPPPAPDLDDVDVDTSGVTADLSFDASNPIAEATYVGVTGIGSLSAVLIDNSFANSGDRVGVINTSTDITGTLNEDVAAHAYSYPANAFGEADLGELILEVNGVVVRTIDLTTAGAVNDGTSTSGFNISDKTSCEFSNGDPFVQFQYRTGSYRVDSNDANLTNGWNYARVIHRISGVDTTTNYVDWVVDANVVDTTFATTNGLHNLIMTGSAYLSGVRYHTGGTADYDVVISNAFRNTYITGDVVTFTCSNGAISAQSLGNSGGNELLDVTITDANFVVTNARQLDATISASTNVNRVFDSNEDNDPGASSSINGLLMDPTGSSGETDLADSFNAEGYRQQSDISLTSTSYSSGSGNGPATWDSTESLVGADAGHNDGLLEYNGTLRYPTQGVNGGDFRNTADGGPGCEEGYSGNPNYSGASGDRVYLRYFYVGASKQNFTFTIAGTGTSFVSVATGASGNNLTMELLVPNTTQNGSATIEFKDCYSTYTDINGIGCYSSGVREDNTSNWLCTSGSRSTSTGGNVIVIRITASSSWTGNISSISVSA